MNVYHYHPVTGEYLRESEANDDPKETASAGEFVPKVPAHATLVAPPGEVAGYARVFDSGSWSQVEDHRGDALFYIHWRGRDNHRLGLNPIRAD